MSEIKLPLALLQESVGVYEKSINGEPLERLESMAATIKGSGDSNPLMEQYLDACKAYQEAFNSYTESARGAISDLRAVADLAEYDANKASIGDIKKETVDFQAGNIETDSAMV